MATIGNAPVFPTESVLPGNLQVTGNATINGTTNSVGALTENSNAVRTVATSGTILQVKSMLFTSSNFSTTSTTYQTVTGFNLSITPTSTSNKILVICSAGLRVTSGGNNNNARGFLALYRDSTWLTNRLDGVYAETATDLNSYNSATHVIMDSPATTSSITYLVKIGTYNSAFTVSIINDPNYANIDSNTLTLMEVVA